MRKLVLGLLTFAMCWFAAYAARAAEVRPPEKAVAGEGAKIATSGDGNATFFLIGPGNIVKQKIQLGRDVELSADDLRAAGEYVAVVRSSGESVTAKFYVAAAKPAQINFLARPSRVPAAKEGVVSGVAFVFDAYNNLVLQPANVKFDLSLADAPPISRSVSSKAGIAWTHMDSGKKQGAAQFVASIPEISAVQSVRRVVQQVAADACNLHFAAQRSGDRIAVTTDPIRDCAGNPLPDGTIVTFTQVDERGRSTVDSRIKRGVARADLPAAGKATISVAAGVVMGNEVQLGGAQ